MRLIFSMFAEDVGLLPPHALRNLLKQCQSEPERLGRYLPELWGKMAGGADRFSLAIGADVKYFNGGLFENTRVFELGREELGELIAAAEADWRTVEPAIFGTLLEQALDTHDRARLGAHYTPRAYVERLVNATVIEPLRHRWEEAQSAIEADSSRAHAHCRNRGGAGRCATDHPAARRPFRRGRAVPPAVRGRRAVRRDRDRPSRSR